MANIKIPYISEIQDDILYLQQSNHSYEIKINNLKEELKRATTELSSAKSKLSEIEKIRKNLESKFSRLPYIDESAQKDFIKQCNEFIKQTNNLIKFKEESTTKLKTISTETNQKISGISSIITQFKKEINQIINKQQNNIETLEQKTSLILSNSEKLNSQITENVKQINDKTQNSLKKENAYEILKIKQESLKTIEGLKSDLIADLNNKVAKLVSDLTEKNNETKKLHQQIEAQKSLLDDRLKTIDINIKNNAIETLQNFSTEVYKEITAEITKLKSEIDTQLTDNQEIHTQVENLINLLKTKLDNIENTLNQSAYIAFENYKTTTSKELYDNFAKLKSTIESKLSETNELYTKADSLNSLLKNKILSIDNYIVQLKSTTESQLKTITEQYDQLFHENNLKFTKQISEFIDIQEKSLALAINSSINSAITKITIDELVKNATIKILDNFNSALSEMGIEQKEDILNAITAMISPKIFTADDSEEAPIVPLPENTHFHKAYNKLKLCVNSGAIPMLVGPAGTGKSTAAEQIARQMGLHYYMANRIQNTFELLGFVDANGNYVKTQFYEAFTKGGIFMFDEVDASSPEALVTINTALAQGYMAFPGHPKSIDKHPNFKIICAGNTFGTGSTRDYTGRNPLDKATLDRFIIIPWNYDKELEDKIIPDKALLKYCWTLREVCAEKDKRIIISTRGIKTLYDLLITNGAEKAFKTETLIKQKFFADTSAKVLSNIITAAEEKLGNIPNRYARVMQNLKQETND